MTSTPPCTATRLEDLTWVEFEELALSGADVPSALAMLD